MASELDPERKRELLLSLASRDAVEAVLAKASTAAKEQFA
jgi:hypothetical protein